MTTFFKKLDLIVHNIVLSRFYLAFKLLLSRERGQKNSHVYRCTLWLRLITCSFTVSGEKNIYNKFKLYFFYYETVCFMFQNCFLKNVIFYLKLIFFYVFRSF